MKHIQSISLFVSLSLIALAFSPSLRGQSTFMDQIGSNGAFFSSGVSYLSENFSDVPTYSGATVDDFTLFTPATLTNVTVAAESFNGFNSYSLYSGYDVDIYSSPAAAANSGTGDLYHATVSSSLASITQPLSGDTDPNSALISLPVNLSLTFGTYYVSVAADGSYADNGEFTVYVNPGLPGSDPGGDNALFVNPSGAYGLTGNSEDTTADAAYKITGTATPEPVTWAMFAFGLLLVSAWRRLRANRGQINSYSPATHHQSPS